MRQCPSILDAAKEELARQHIGHVGHVEPQPNHGMTLTALGLCKLHKSIRPCLEPNVWCHIALSDMMKSLYIGSPRDREF